MECKINKLYKIDSFTAETKYGLIIYDKARLSVNVRFLFLFPFGTEKTEAI